MHYLFVTIHPYYDGNGRTARLLATFILQRDGYGLNGFFSLEEHHARDLSSYYALLAVDGQHNYYMGRADGVLTPWVEYFVALLSRVFNQAQEEALRLSNKNTTHEPEPLRRLDLRERRVLSLFAWKDRVTAHDVAALLGLSTRMVRLLMKTWVNNGWLVMADTSNRGRAYILSEIYRKFIGNKGEK